MTVNFNEDKQLKRVEELHLKEAEELAQMIARRRGLPYIDLSKISISTDALRLIPEATSKEARAAAFKVIGKRIAIATTSPDEDIFKNITSDFENKGFKIEIYLVSENSLERAWDRYRDVQMTEKTEAGMIEISNERINKFLENLHNLNDVVEKIKEGSDNLTKEGGISALLEVILSGALSTEASDVHFEPEEDSVRLRYRLDGVLQDLGQVNHKTYIQILSRIKLISGLKLNIKGKAQDGRFSIKARDLEIEIRTSIIPGAYGESIVLRVLNPETIAVEFNNLGIEDRLLKIFDEEIRKPNGLVLLTGPTGSGKTTTLYSFLRAVNSPEDKIITIEDPIEYHLKGINQTQVNDREDYTFLSGLRSALRQDPDIIMVGEIRDTETARIAVNASLTGHLVFSTLHTNNAAGTIPRLIDLGINPKIIASSLTISIAQRLVRKLCQYCKKEEAPNTEELNLITRIFEEIKIKRPDISLPNTDKVWRAGKCEKCNHTGYKGRIGIFEAILMDEKVAEISNLSANEKEIRIAAMPQGILDMRQDGFLKAINGITSIDEVSRVVDLYEGVI